MPDLPQRKRLHHVTPPWVSNGAVFFVTINAKKRSSDALVRDSRGSNLLASAAHYHDRNVWWLHLMLLMPDHLHALLAIPPDRELVRTISAWKSYQTKTLKIEWQPGFFDHRLRTHESLDEKALYIAMNPVRAGLVPRPEDWPYVWRPNPR